jgi:tetratricopeptide (TPR) repeat protein
MRLSSLVNPSEASVFAEFAEIVRQRSAALTRLSWVREGGENTVLKQIEAALQEALNDMSISACIKGSTMKGTETNLSDLDIVVDTPRRTVTRADKLAVVEKLRKHPLFHKSHVVLKKLAIGCIIHNVEIDLVFACTKEYGELPGGLSERFAENPTAQRAARLLKVAFRQAASNLLPEILPSFVFEILALETQEAQDRSTFGVVGDGSMQLFVDALQLLFDAPRGEILNDVQRKWFGLAAGEADGIRGRTLEEQERSSVREHAGALLRLFCASRFYTPNQEGLVDLCVMERWLRAFRSSNDLPTKLGHVPSWLMGCPMGPDLERVAFIHSTTGVLIEKPKRSIEECRSAAHATRAAELFATSPFAKYVGCDARKRPPSGALSSGMVAFRAHLEQLKQHATQSEVARRMLACRMLWWEGEVALSIGNFDQAVRLFAQSLRRTHADGDPFGGMVCGDPGRYFKAAGTILQEAVGPRETDARLVRAGLFMQTMNPKAGEAELTAAARGASSEFSIFFLRSTVRGNLNNWSGALLDIERCGELDPAEPICHFWRGIILQRLKKPLFKKAAACFQYFLRTASPEGRKVSQALFELAFCEMILNDSNQRTVNTAAAEYAREGFVAEERMLPLLREHEARTGDSDAKKMCQLLFRAVPQTILDENMREEGRQRADASSARTTFETDRQQANAAFEAGCYEVSIEAYTRLVDDIPHGVGHIEKAKLFSNRSVAHEKMHDFNDAENDAREVIRLRPDWPKGYARLARARLSKHDAVGAVAALEQACGVVPEAQISQLRSLKSEARSLLNDGMPRPVDVSSLLCWASVEFKESVIVVAQNGGADFVSLRDAIKSVSQPTSIVVLPGSYALAWPAIMMGTKLRVQIIGAGDVKVSHHPGGRSASIICVCSSSAHVSLHSLKLNASARGASAAFDQEMQPMHVSSSSAHCVAVLGGGSCDIQQCALVSITGASCYTDGPESTVQLSKCEFLGVGGGLIATHEGFVEANRCHFTRSRNLFVEVRKKGRGCLENCTFLDAESQAVMVYNGGAEVKMMDCIVKGCGDIRSKSAVMVCTGKLTLLRCNIENNRGDGVVMQAEDKTSELVVTSCVVCGNGGQGIVAYGGQKMVLSENRIQENARAGISCAGEAGTGLPLRSAHLARNVLVGNGNRFSIMLTGKPKDLARRFMIEGNDVDGCCVLIPEPSVKMVKHILGGTDVRSLTGNARFVDTFTGQLLPNNSPWSSGSQRRMQHSMVANRVQHCPVATNDIAAVHFQKRTLIDAQERAVESGDDRRALNKDPQYAMQDSPGLPPDNARSVNTRRLSECRISELAASAGSYATGRVLYGTICTEPVRYKSLMTVLEDDFGAAVLIALYNVPQVEWNHWRECFPKGAIRRTGGNAWRTYLKEHLD